MPVVILTIVFVVLKLTHVIAWDWIWVLSPLWIGAIALASTPFIVIIFGLLIVVAAFAIFGSIALTLLPIFLIIWGIVWIKKFIEEREINK